MAHKDSERKVFSCEGNGYRAIELALIKGCTCWAHKSLIVFVDDNYALACRSPIVFPKFIKCEEYAFLFILFRMFEYAFLFMNACVLLECEKYVG